MEKKIVTHYVYALYYESKPFYVGMSVNPVKRLYDHFGPNAYEKVSRFLSKKNIADISINVLEKYDTKKAAKCVDCVEREQKWILKFIRDGHNLLNTTIAFNKY